MIELLYISILIISVIAGGLFVTITNQGNSQNQNTSKLILAFSGGFILSIAFLDFIPHLYESNSNFIGYYILLGFLIQLVLEFFSRGIEHGHTHIEKNSVFPLALLIALCFHSILEGIPLGNEINHLHGHGHSNAQNLFLGIVFHQIPVSIALMSVLINTKITKQKAWLCLIVFSLTTPLGMGISKLMPYQGITINDSFVLAIVVGIFLHISTTIIFETNENHKFNFIKLLSIIAGFALALASSSMH